MTKEERKDLLFSFQGKQALTLISKGNDYANEDTLSNFKIRAQIHKLLKVDTTTPEGICIDAVILKLVRYCNLRFNDKTPANEPIEDTLLDLNNYSFLQMALEEDKKPKDPDDPEKIAN